MLTKQTMKDMLVNRVEYLHGIAKMIKETDSKEEKKFNLLIKWIMKKVTKIILRGASDVGKSSLVCRINDNTFNKENDKPIGSSFISKKVYYNEKQYLIQLWNFRLYERIKEIQKYFYNGIDGLFLFLTSQIEIRSLGYLRQ